MVERRRAIADPAQVARGTGDLGGDDDLLALLAFEPAPDNGFRNTIGFGARWNGVHLGGIEEIDPAGQRVIELAVGVGLAGLLAEGHRAEADIGYDERAAAEGAGIELAGHDFLRNLAVFQG